MYLENGRDIFRGVLLLICTAIASWINVTTGLVLTIKQKGISGPILDRIDIHIKVLRVDYEKPTGDRFGEPSEEIRKRLQAAQDIELQRFSTLDSTNLKLMWGR